MNRKFIGFSSNLLISLFVLLLSLVVIEVFLRTFVVPIERDNDGVQVVEDADLGFRLKENQRSTFTNGHFNTTVQTNEHGYRDAYDERFSNPGIIAIGDSYTFGHGIEVDETWVEQLQNEIKMNIINLGVFGYSPWQYEPQIKRINQEIQPVKVVLYAMSWNDAIADQRFEVSEKMSAETRQKLEEQDAIVALRKKSIYNLVLNKTALGLLLQESTRKILSYLSVKTTQHQDLVVIKNLESTKEILERLNEYLEGIGAELVIVHIGTGNFVMTDRWKEYRRRHNFSRYIVREKFTDWAKLQGISFHDAIDDLETKYLSGGKKRASVLLPVDNHYNKAGNAVIAKVFSGLLHKRKVLDSLRA